jgi:hypothetical protein
MSSEEGYELQRNGEPWFMTRNNGALFTYFGRLAVHNHVFLILDWEDNLAQHVWVENPLYAKLAKFIIENNYVQHLNMAEVSKSDLAQHHADLLQDLKNTKTVPKDWLREAQE